MFENRREKIAKVKKEISKYKFNIPVESLPEIPEVIDAEIMTFICYHMETLCKSDAKEFLSYMMFVLTEVEYEELILNLFIMGVEIDEISPSC
jgi:hypothetical protein